LSPCFCARITQKSDKRKHEFPVKTLSRATPAATVPAQSDTAKPYIARIIRYQGSSDQQVYSYQVVKRQVSTVTFWIQSAQFTQNTVTNAIVNNNTEGLVVI